MAKHPTAQGASSAPRFVAVGIAPTDEQIAIQTSRARHVIAMANAGAAKTTTLALRIAESITRGVWPESIVALTFSSEAARVLQARLIEIGVDAKVARRVRCVTFDALAQQVLNDFEGVQPPFLASNEALAPHVRAYTRRSLLKLFRDQPVHVVAHLRIYGGFDNLIARMGRAGLMLRRFWQGIEGTPLEAL